MELINLETVQAIDVLSGVFVVTSPDGLLMEAWQRPEVHFDFAHVISLFGEVLRPTADIAQHLGSDAPSLLIMDCDAGIVLARALSADFFCVFLFSPQTPLGLLRIYTEQVTESMAEQLPHFPDEELPSLGLSVLSPALSRPASATTPEHIVRAQRLIEVYLSNVSEPDRHTAIMQLAMATNLTVHDLEQLHHLDVSALPRLEASILSLLGLDRLNI